jgi:hypothetical protein
MRGYYEEMAHCFVCDFGIIDEISVGFYETLGLMIGNEVTLQSAFNPYVETTVSYYYQTCKDTVNYYLQYNTGPPGVSENIWPTEVLSHIFKIEVIDVCGWAAFTNTFNYLQTKSYPLRQYVSDHTWGGFLSYLSEQTTSDLNEIFSNYGLPKIQWFEENGYKKGVLQINTDYYSFRVRFFDREGNQPIYVKLHTYSSISKEYQDYFFCDFPKSLPKNRLQKTDCWK